MEETRPLPPIVASIIRTFVPYLVGYVLTLLAKAGFGLPEEAVTELLTIALGTLYYALARVLETRFKPVWGWLIGLPKSPTYDATAKVDPDSPTGESAAPASEVAPEDAPVETIPAGEPALVDDEVDQPGEYYPDPLHADVDPEYGPRT